MKKIILTTGIQIAVTRASSFGMSQPVKTRTNKMAWASNRPAS